MRLLPPVLHALSVVWRQDFWSPIPLPDVQRNNNPDGSSSAAHAQAKARTACFSYNEGWYNPVRLHSDLGYRSPITYEREMQKMLTNR
jgi:transposase InsO family protein